jgi:hypothetical protein
MHKAVFIKVPGDSTLVSFSIMEFSFCTCTLWEKQQEFSFEAKFLANRMHMQPLFVDFTGVLCVCRCAFGPQYTDHGAMEVVKYIQHTATISQTI